jgi:hypothetical protein
LVAASLAAACAPRGTHAELAVARADYIRARSDPAVQQKAPAALDEARRMLERAEAMWERDGAPAEIAHLSYLVQKDVEIARALADYEQARAEIEAATRLLNAQRVGGEAALYSASAVTPVDVIVRSASRGVVGGTLVNRSTKPIRDVDLMVNYQWLWRNETHPGDVSPGRTEYFRIAEPIPPQGSVDFTYRPDVPLPARNDGRFETSVQVVGFR